MSWLLSSVSDSLVALRKESVDRNGLFGADTLSHQQSLSVRRAWIEISMGGYAQSFRSVALRKESVDRNITLPVFYAFSKSRSP